MLGELLANRYSIKSLPREGDKKGGGVALIYKDTYSVNVKHVERHTSFECLHVKVTVNSVLLRLLVIYSHLPKSGNAAEGDLFLSEFSEMMDSLLLCSGKVFIIGDFNYHVDDCEDTTIQNFLQLVSAKSIGVGPGRFKILRCIKKLETRSIRFFSRVKRNTIN